MKACKGPEAPEALTLHQFMLQESQSCFCIRLHPPLLVFLEKGWGALLCMSYCLRCSAGGVQVTGRACK